MAENEVKEVVLTAEQQKAKDAATAEFAEGKRQSLMFARANPSFPMNQRNAETMWRELKKRNLIWTASNLQAVWADPNFDRGLIDPEDSRPAAKEPTPLAIPAIEVVEPEQFPWGLALEGSEGKARVAAMDNLKFKRFATDRRTGTEFQRQVNELRMTRSELRKGDL